MFPLKNGEATGVWLPKKLLDYLHWKKKTHVGRRLHAPKRESTIHCKEKNKIGTRGKVVLQFLLGTTTIPTLKKLFSENTPISKNYKSRECISLEVTLSTLNLKNKYYMYIYTQCLDCWVSDKTSIRSISIYSSYGRCRYGSLPQNLNTNIYIYIETKCNPASYIVKLHIGFENGSFSARFSITTNLGSKLLVIDSLRFAVKGAGKSSYKVQNSPKMVVNNWKMVMNPRVGIHINHQLETSWSIHSSIQQTFPCLLHTLFPRDMWNSELATRASVT